MSCEQVIQSIQKLVNYHEQLKKVSVEKTEVIKSGNMDGIQPMLAKEKMLSQYIEKEEAIRVNQVEEWFVSRQLPPEIDRTITNMLERLQGNEQAALEKITTNLTYLIKDIKEQEHLNHGLIQQSLQFVHMSLHMLQPSIQQMNYGKKNTQTPHVKRSVFDSKA
ncbi:MAG TPA: flagellar protein FlgN [Bacillota bacterium]|nr:flagellar protein FlgN [Bacillota bacterium]